MGKSPKENLVFGILMVTGMVIGMTLYNLVLHLGFRLQVLPRLALGFWPGFAVAFVLEALLVGRLAHWVAHRVACPVERPRRHLVTLKAVIMGTMVTLMSVYGALLHGQGGSGFGSLYLSTLWKNALAAVPLNLLVVTPLVLRTLQWIFPPAKAAQILEG
nr:hypothetical protein [uncultured Holophaga sp.]